MPIRVLIVDSSSTFRARLREILAAASEFEIVGACDDGCDALQACLELRPDVVLLDIALPNSHGIEVLEGIQAARQPLRAVVLTDQKSPLWIQRALDAGAAGYLFKDADLPGLPGVLRAVHAGEICLSPLVPRLLLEWTLAPIGAGRRGVALTKREAQVLELIAGGKTSKEIGTVLQISARTVDAHRSNIMKKLRVHTLAELVRYELEHRSSVQRSGDGIHGGDPE